AGTDLVRTDLVLRAVDLTRMLRLLMPDEREVGGLLSLMLLTDARRETRTDSTGRLLLLEEQDRSRWDRAAIDEGQRIVGDLLRGGPVGRFTLQAAIAAEHARATSYDVTDWSRLLQLYDALLRVWPTPVVVLNRAVVLAMVDGPAAALEVVDGLVSAGKLSGYRYLPATRADLLRRLGRGAEAADAYRSTLDLAENEAERQFLTRRLGEISGD
ncbi:MAG: RNA polymerase sigma factor, partial [Actinomycetes bacterium]